MSPGVVGQRCMSEREPELGLGVVANVDAGARRIAIEFPATKEKRLYALGTPVLKRVEFRPGETIATQAGGTVVVETVTEAHGLLTYQGEGRTVREDAISDVTSVSLPQERLLAAQVDPGEVFDLRLQTLRAQARFRESDVRGFLGGRIDLIPHQFYILHEVASRQIPRVLLADEVGLGKTIEACLILQRLLAVGQVKRGLILVPESLTHQWFVELLRRFNLWFSIYDEARCLVCEQSDPGANPFLATQLALCSVAFLAADENRRDQAIGAGWDLLIVDEAHHLAWTPEAASPEYALVEQLARKTRGVLLLTATPTQLGQAGHFARLRLLDPDRYSDFARFVREAEGFGTVAPVVEHLAAGKPLTTKDRKVLETLFARDPLRLGEHLAGLGRGEPEARAGLLRALIDQHGPGRVIFRNTRAAMTGFPQRQFRPVALDSGGNPALLARTARELVAEETGQEAGLRYSLKDDPRIGWLATFLIKIRPAKVLLICKSQRKVAAIAAALLEKLNLKVGQFHEGLPLIQRDRNAAWFAEPDGAQLLLCSEIGSEGRNFQFAHHLVLFDLPLNPGLVEQRIGRLDRIGQTQPIQIHVPYLTGSAGEAVVTWYHEGLDAFEAPLHGGDEYRKQFRERLLALAERPASAEPGAAAGGRVSQLIAEAARFRQELNLRMQHGRDRLLEMNSFNRPVAEGILSRVRAADVDPFLREFLVALLDHFGVRIKEYEEGDVFFDPGHAYVEAFPSIPAEGMLATFTRARALAREDITFLSPDHALVQNSIDLLLDSKAGTTAFGYLETDEPNVVIEAIFILESLAGTSQHVDRFLSPTPIRVVVDIRGTDLTDRRNEREMARDFEDKPIQRFFEKSGFDAPTMKVLTTKALESATARSEAVKQTALIKSEHHHATEIGRLTELQKANDHVRLEEIMFAQEQLGTIRAAISASRLRLDSIRMIVEGPLPIS